MLNHRYIKTVARILGWNQDSSWPEDLLTPDQTRLALERERNRAERTGTELSVVTFFAPASDSQRSSLFSLAHTLKSRLRNTDEIGRLSEHQVCAMLLATPQAIAEKVIEKVLDQLPTSVARPHYVVASFTNNQPTWQDEVPDDSPSSVGLR